MWGPQDLEKEVEGLEVSVLLLELHLAGRATQHQGQGQQFAQVYRPWVHQHPQALLVLPSHLRPRRAA